MYSSLRKKYGNEIANETVLELQKLDVVSDSEVFCKNCRYLEIEKKLVCRPYIDTNVKPDCINGEYYRPKLYPEIQNKNLNCQYYEPVVNLFIKKLIEFYDGGGMGCITVILCFIFSFFILFKMITITN